ncbi:DUF4876 domain-containing protein [Pedobacter sp. MC2016-05]|uniref:DUF4876 domain-containing protein n=1 Tax=Pedobacter sp. MC2016-05 TaxID=2994474 RepID=UPI002245C62D|nr:DUF4876 domain-containing protein [Pedobacter sp. MC2016-05]MCX2476453.1 DUF4876 domain-containing protein [Pedobacter sp. MC2016-05]
MKKYLLLLISVFALTSCKKEKTTEIVPVDLNLNVSYRTETSGYQLPLNEVKVKVTNVDTKNTLQFTTNDKGKLVAPQLSPGTYDLDATITITAARYSTLTGIQSPNDVTFNASVKNKVIGVGFTETIDLTLVTGTISDWVIKQIYYAGSDRVNGATYRDNFIEFYNNSDKTLYADGLCFTETTGIITVSTPPRHHLLSNGQYDWNKAEGIPAGIDANNDYIYVRAFLKIPGTGSQYAVQPGKSIIVAQSAINHKSPFTGLDGKTISVLNPALTVDLSGADFEAHYGSLVTRPLASDVDNPLVPNLEVFDYFGNDMIFDGDGRYSYALLKFTDGVNPANFPQYAIPTLTVSSTASKVFQIPAKYILDAVEVQPTEANKRVPKKYSANLDAGFAFNPAGQYTSQSVIRKTDKTINGRIILKDTNNSTEDFTFLEVANPRGFK